MEARPDTLSRTVADLPLRFADPDLQSRLDRAVDPEARIARAVAALCSIGSGGVWLRDEQDRDAWHARLASQGLEVRLSDPDGPLAGSGLNVAFWPISHRTLAPAQTADPAEPPTVDRADAFLARSLPGPADQASLLVVEDYGRDDVAALVGGTEREQDLVALSRRDGPFLSRGFRLRVLHCWWRWDSLEKAGTFLAAAFGGPGEARARSMRRPRLAYNVAIYHRLRREDRG